MSKIIASFLENQGLNVKDIEIYLDIYKHGQSFASSVSHRTGIDRTTVYSVIKRLLKRGVIAQTRINDVSAYLAVSPEVFVNGIDSDIEDLIARKKVANLFVEEMKTVAKSSFNKPKIRIYEGEQAIINLYEETLEKDDLQKAFISLTTLPENLKKFLRKRYVGLKLKKGVFSKVLVGETKFSNKYKSWDSHSNRETRIVKSHPFNLHSEIMLFGGRKVAIIDFHKQPYGMVISSETLYKTVDGLFDFVWGVA